MAKRWCEVLHDTIYDVDAMKRKADEASDSWHYVRKAQFKED